MKKTILALTIPALFATSVSAVEIYSDEEGSKIDLYGRLQYDMGALDYQSNGDAENFGGEGEARLGVNVQYGLNQDVDLIGKYEAEIASENETSFDVLGDEVKKDSGVNTRYAWLGFRFQDTTDLTFGKSEAPRALLTDLTDTFDIFGGTVADAGSFNRVDDQIRLAYAAYGFDVRAAYSFNDNAKKDGNFNIKNRYGIAAGYTLPINLGFVASFDRTDYGGNAKFFDRAPGTWGTAALGDLDRSHDNNTDWGLGVHYTIDGFYFAGLYGQRNFDYYNYENGGNRYWELQAAYNVENWTLTADYENQKGRKGDSSGDRAKLQKVDQYTLGARYAFTPKTRVFAEYVINDVSGKDDLYGVGIQYNF